jgi:hypothetical protein
VELPGVDHIPFIGDGDAIYMSAESLAKARLEVIEGEVEE